MIIKLLSGYNSYYNHKIKVHSDYETWVVHTINNVNFNPNDNVRTEHICNYDGENGDVNYMLLIEENLEGGLDTIVSRWFVLDAIRLRNGQCRFILKRDVVADYIYQVITSTCIVHKGYIRDYNDPAIYNRDGNYNRIKKAEYLLKDETRTPWVVGYIAKDTAEAEITASYADIGEATYEVNGIENWEHYNKSYSVSYSVTTWFRFTADFRSDYALPAKFKDEYVFNRDTLIRKTHEKGEYTGGLTFRYDGSGPAVQQVLANIRVPAYYNMVNAWAETAYDYIDEDDITPLSGRIIKDTNTGIYYRIKLDYTEGDYTKRTPPSDILTFLNDNLIYDPPALGDSISGTPDDDTWKLAITTQKVAIQLEQIFNNISTTITTDRNHLEDAPYDMFCIPYGNLLVRYGGLTETFTTNKNAAIPLATAISEQLGAKCYDIQLLPYFPCQEILRNNDTNLRVTRTKFNLVKDSYGNNVSVMIWARTSEFTFNIGSSLSNLPAQYDALSKKVRHETLMYRICSPNYASAFEFSPAANNGVTRYIVSCTYKPYDPYIHINPYFNEDGLYGGNYNDARGLICSGDFSLTQVSDAWVNYQLQNKNFQRMFDRQIESLELQQRVGKVQDVVGATVGTAQGAATGAIMGAPGGGYGIAAGAIIGGVGSLAGGIADITLNQQLREDQLGLTRFNFNAQLDNIRALPDTLTKVSTLNPQNKIFPFVEKYEATDDEIKLCKESITWQGMTINKIGTISDYRNLDLEECFIQATLLRSDIRDNHIIDAIADELNKGVYFERGGLL